MIIDPKKKASTLATAKHSAPFKPLDLSSDKHRAMAEAIRRSERQPKLISMTSNAAINKMPGWK